MNLGGSGGAGRGGRTAGVGFIFVTLLIDVLGLGLVIPIMPKLVQQLTGDPVAGAGMYGILLGCYGLMQFLFAPVLGSLSDKVGRRPVLLVSLLCNGFDYIVLALAPTIGWLFLGRVVSGISGASFTTASAYIADVSPPEKRAANFGVIGAAFGIGFIVGPVVGGLLGDINPRLPFWAAASLSLANFLYGLFLVPESLSAENRNTFSWTRANPIGSLGLLSRYRATLLLGFVFVFSGLAQQSLQSTWVLSNTYRFHWNAKENGLALALVGLFSGGVQAGLSRVVIPKIGESAAIIGGMTINCLGYVLFGSAVASWMVYGTIIFWSLGGIGGPALQSVVSKSYGANEQGAVQGALTSIQSLTGIVGPIMGTAVFGYFTSSRSPIQVPGASFFLGAVLVLISILLAIPAVRQPEVLAEA